MIYYATNRYELSLDPNCDYQYEVLNELKDDTSGKIENLLKHTRFVFEVDTMSLQDQWDMIKPMLDKIVRVVYSGGKSLHTIIEFDPKFEESCKTFYPEIWNYINDHYFNGKADTQCKNPNRLTRRPNVFRWDEKHTNVKQELLYNKPNNFFPDAKIVIRNVRSMEQGRVAMLTLHPPKKLKVGHQNNGMCKNYDVIRHYLDTPYLKKTGNGDSSISLFKAILCCLKYSDIETLEEVLDKARSEHWKETELNHKILDAQRKLV